MSMGFSAFAFLPLIALIVQGLFALLGLYALFLLIKLLIRLITAVELYIDDKKKRRL